MSWFFAGRKSDHVMLENGGRSLDFSISANRAAFLAALSANYGVDVSGISLYVVDDGDTAAARVRQGDEYSLAWADDEITGVDFSAEDAKRIITVTPALSTISADGTDAAALTFAANLPGGGVDTSYNLEILAPFYTPSGSMCCMKVQFASGECVKQFKTKNYGTWRTAARADIAGKNARMGESAVINVTLVM
jgi:hypothetical protein